jgi:[protein-PII] uridylyltransferase
MKVPEEQGDTVDMTDLSAALRNLFPEEKAPPASVRQTMLALIKGALKTEHAAIRDRFEAGARGEDTVRAISQIMDILVRTLADTANDRVYPSARGTEAERICIAAVGGYGRGELAPSSDIDLLFLLPYKETPRIEQIIEYILYLLWDCGLKVGHATRSIAECIRLSKDDITIRTAVLEARYLWGERELFDQLRSRFAKELIAGSGPQFVAAKLDERDRRHQRVGGSRYVLEPNIKDGKGGLRDLQTLFWIAKYLYRIDTVDGLVAEGVLTREEAAHFAKAQNFLWTVRCHLHYLTNRGEDRLTFDLQSEIGRRMGYRERAGARGVERFMKHYYLTAKEVGDLTRIFCAALEAEHRGRPRFSLPLLGMFKQEVDGFSLEGGRLTVASGNEFRDDPVRMIRLFHAAQENELDIHPRALRLITRNLRLVDTIREDADANRLFMAMLTSPKTPEITLRRLNEAGVFGRFIPDFGRVVAQMQHDMYHVFTVDEHTIFAIGILHGIEQGEYTDEMPAASEAVHKVGSRKALYLALLLHDIAKGRGGNHSEIGAEVALRLGPRLGLTDEETETVSWLVRHHLLLSNTAFHRDLNDPQTIKDLVEVVQSLERLRLLLVLTVADIRAVGPNVWNAWKAALIRELYYAAEDVLSGGHLAERSEARVERAQVAMGELLSDWTAEEIAGHVALGYQSYWLAFEAETLARHAEMVRRTERDGALLTVETRVDERRGVSEITIHAGDHPGLFSRIAGAMAMSGASIVDAKIFTMTNGMALDVFEIQDASGQPFAQDNQIARLEKQIDRVLSGRVDAAAELARKTALPSRTQVFTVAPRVLIDNSASRTHSVIEVNGRDRPGLLYDVTRELTELGLQISSALITTYGERAVDVFYVKDAFGMQISHKAKLEQIRAGLLEALTGEAPEKPGTRGTRSRSGAAE